MNTVPYKIVKELPETDVTKPLFADTETCGLYGKIRLLQLYQEGWPEVIMVEWPEPMLVAKFINENHTIWHNAHYDITVVQTALGRVNWVPNKFHDTFLLARLHFPYEEKFSLDEVMTYCIGFDPYVEAGLDKKVLQKSKWDALILTKEQELYAATDVYYMPDVWHAVYDQLDTPSYKLDILTLRHCLDFQWNGMPVDPDRLLVKYSDNKEAIAKLAVPINVNSWQQVRPYIGEDESDDLALATFALQGNEKADKVRQARKLRKQNSFLDKFENNANRIYGKFLPSARSGRLTSKDQNLQQLPRSTKTVFGYPEGSDRVLIYADYAQLELRTICAITSCSAMEKLFREGADLHGFTAEMLFGADWTKEQRQLSKTYNFSFLYGGGIEMLISILIKTANTLLSYSQANTDRRRWRNLWREIYAWQERGIKAWKNGRLGSTPMGRRYKAKMMTDQLNIENQGAGAEVAKLALHYLMSEKLVKYPEVKLLNFIHDSFIIECPNDPELCELVAIDLAEAMQEAWFEMSKLFAIKDLPMPVDVSVGRNWGDIENDDIEDLWTYQLEGMALFNSK